MKFKFLVPIAALLFMVVLSACGVNRTAQTYPYPGSPYPYPGRTYPVVVYPQGRNVYGNYPRNRRNDERREDRREDRRENKGYNNGGKGNNNYGNSGQNHRRDRD